MLLLIRLITATFLFAFLGKANIWLTPLSNTILALGYRVFILLTPIIELLSERFAIVIALLLASLGAVLFCASNNHLILVLGALLVGIGFGTSGYLIKNKVAETPKGAGYNKIAINIGSIFSGILLIISIESKSFFFGVSAFVLLLAAVIALLYCDAPKHLTLKFPQKTQPRKLAGWIAVGIVIGIKFFGVFSVLPQFLLHRFGTLPKWYGAMIFINSGAIVLFQMPIIHFIDKLKKNINSFRLTLILMFFGMLLIALPSMFKAEYFIGAAIWTFLLSLVECSASYLDFAASQEGYLLTKEASIGIGAGLTVFITRYGDATYNSIFLGLLGAVLILLIFCLLKEN